MSCRDSSENQAIISRNIREKLDTTGLRVLRPVGTDMDLFPYNRFYRGMVSCDRPRIFDREAGYRPWRPGLYMPPTTEPDAVPPFMGCFQIPCSTILPCMPDTAFKKPVEFCINTSP